MGCFCHFNGFEVKDAYCRKLVGVDAGNGCYYRMVDGEKEFINPPMAPDTEYRTTERYNGLPVYVKLLRKSFNIAGDNQSHEIGTYPPDAIVIDCRAIVQEMDSDGMNQFKPIPSAGTDGTFEGESVSANNVRAGFYPGEGYEGDVIVNLPEGKTYNDTTVFSVTIKYVKP